MQNKLYTTDEAISLLKVSRITLYRWIRAGKLPASKVGSTYRFRRQDIDNYLLGRPTITTDEAITPPSRSPLDITARDLEQWASDGNKAAQGILPELVRRLIEESREAAEVSKLHIPTGDATSLHGWDGMVISSNKHLHIPPGTSAWEMGAGEPSSKAQKDYKNRTKNPLNVVPSEATFTFVTPRTWQGSDDWIARKFAEKPEWKDIRVIDAVDLESWLEISPVTKRWFMKVLNRPQNGLRDIESFWNEWKGETNPPISHQLLLAGRAIQREALLKKLLEQSAQVITVSASTTYEAAAFVAATIISLDDEDFGKYASSVLVVDSKEAWDYIVNSAKALTLMPIFADIENFSSALANGHKVVLPVDRSSPRDVSTITLETPRRSEVRDELISMGLPERLAQEYSYIGRNSIHSLWRKLAVVKANRRPLWVDDHQVLIPAMLVGQWDEGNEADKKIVALVAGVDYEVYAKQLEDVARKADSPLLKVGSKWFVASKSDLWDLLGGYITKDRVDSFINASVELLSEINPAYDLPVSERWMAALHNKQREYSGEIRQSVADTLAYVASRQADRQLGSTNGTLLVKTICRQVYEAALLDDSCHLWASLSDVIYLLAEAEPEELLKALEKELKGNPDKLRYLFQDSKSNGTFFGSSSPHTGYLNALEAPAWLPEYLLRSSYILARLHELDIKDGSYSNRPLASLKDIFLAWHHQTNANVTERQEVLKAIVKRYPETGWELLLCLLPDSHEVTTGTYNPRWRDWMPEKQSVTYAEMGQMVEAVSTMLINAVQNNPNRLLGLIKQLDGLPPSYQKRFAHHLSSLSLDDFTPQERAELWEALRSVIHHHRRFSKQSWAIPKQQLDLFDAAIQHLEPSDELERVKSLFDHHVELPNVDEADWEKYRKAVDAARRQAVTNIYEANHLAGLLKLKSQVESPHYLGIALGGAGILTPEEYDEIFSLLDADHDNATFSRAVAIGRFYPADWDWAKDSIKTTPSLQSPGNLGVFLSVLPTDHQTWALVDSVSTEAQDKYWSLCSPYTANDDVDYQRLATEMIRVGNPYGAIEVLSHYIDKPEKQPAKELVFSAIEGFLRQDSKGTPKLDLSMFRYHMKRLLDYLYETSLEANKKRLAQIEWPLLSVMGDEVRPKVLHEELASDPVFFNEVVKWVYRRRGAKKKKISKLEQRKAKLGHDLLDSWRLIPGASADGITADALMAWFEKARELLKKSGRQEVGEQTIGHVLAASKVDPIDGIWPEQAVRDIIEHAESDELEDGIRVALYNRRGVTSRGIGEGGGQERVLAEKYISYEARLGVQYPRTKSLMKSIAAMWQYDADRQDKHALEEEME